MDQPQHCYSCGTVLVREHAHICPLCGRSFCYEHKDPEAHNCIKLGTMDWDVYRHERDLWRRKNPRVSLGDKAPIDYEQVRAAHEIRHLKQEKQDWSLLYFIGAVVILLIVIYLIINMGEFRPA